MTTAAAGVPAGLSSAVLGIALLALAPPEARSQRGFKEALPEHTVFYAAAPNLERWYDGFRSSPLYKVWQEEEVQEFLADALALGKQSFDQYLAMARQMHAQGRLPIDPDALLKIRIEGASCAITDLDLPGGPKPARISFVGCLDFGQSGPVVQEALGILVGLAKAQARGGARFETKQVAGNTFEVMLPPEEAAKDPRMPPTFGIMWGFVGGKLLIGTDVQRLSEIAAALAGQTPETGLPDDPTYRQVAGHIRTDRADLEVYLRPDALVDVAIDVLRLVAEDNDRVARAVDFDGVGRAVDTLGLRTIRGIGFASGYDGGKGFFKSFAVCPAAQRKGLTALGSGGPIQRKHFAWLPKDVGAFTIANVGDLDRIYTVILRAISAYDEGVGRLVESKLGEVEKSLGLDFRKDIFGAFGPELITYSMPVTGLMATPEMVVMLQCKDTGRTLEVLQKLAKLSNGVVAINESKTADATFYSIDLVLDDLGMGMDPTSMLDPTFAFRNGYFVFGMSREDVKGALERFTGAGLGADVRTNPAFQPYLATIPEDVASLSFTDVAATVDGIYGTVSGVLGMVPIPPDIPVDLGLLPSVDTLTKHLFGSVTWSTLEPDGFASEHLGPFGPELIAVAGIAVGAGAAALAVFAGRQGRARVRRVGAPGQRRRKQGGKDGSTPAPAPQPVPEPLPVRRK